MQPKKQCNIGVYNTKWSRGLTGCGLHGHSHASILLTAQSSIDVVFKYDIFACFKCFLFVCLFCCLCIS